MNGVWVPQGAGQVFRRPRLDPARHAVEALVEQRAQRPAGAVAGQHVEVVDVQVALAVRRADGRAVHLVQPVVGGDLAGDVEDQPAQRITLVGVGAHPPVLARQVFVHRGGHVDQRLAVAAHATVAGPMQDEGLGAGVVAGLHQRLLGEILDRFQLHRARRRQAHHHALRQLRRLPIVELATGPPRGGNGQADTLAIERHALAAAPDHPVRHLLLTPTYRFNENSKHNMLC